MKISKKKDNDFCKIVSFENLWKIPTEDFLRNFKMWPKFGKTEEKNLKIVENM